ncbi:multicopper oxidase domain-containing protein [Nitrosomonas sp. Is37]|uniref:multicopper oxidase domain-containing protein n=1 Tax=Nitrosomonas sp. Is37 TaxID=3080535 RepID=UPI00294A9E70|nr:multicopper oxidase domain-containing protein [Nitrosomonas sp. Is37]MDV6343325.1 multicopper oxidase domain-containing protein [Nitrosomonas sp. Is37]
MIEDRFTRLSRSSLSVKLLHIENLSKPKQVFRRLRRVQSQMSIRKALLLCLSATTFYGTSFPTANSAKFDIPTGTSPTPLFGAPPFSQKMLLLEEMGSQPLVECRTCTSTLPQPNNIRSSPKGAALDAFLKEPIHPFPMEQANIVLPNPWQDLIETHTGPLNFTAIEGRPPGEFYAHQRWLEFFPLVWVQTAQSGARRNEGLRNDQQRHRYAVGEFSPGGLYHNTTGRAGFEGSTKGIKVRFHPRMPVQHPNSVWTFDGTFPPKLIMARYGEPILFRHYNALPIDETTNNGFGRHTISTHEHNGHNPAESDGFAHAYFYPGQFFDYRWPMILAGTDTINTDKSDPRAGTPDGNGGIMRIRGDYRETMSTHWFHDHMQDFTSQNVYKGNAAMMNYYSALDRGNEGLEDGVNLRLPSGTALDWGNRDYDVNVIVADKAWDQNGQLFFNIFQTDGFLGDRMTVNWLYKPYFDVRSRRYRFRILNASVARWFKIALVTASGQRVPFHMIANDGNVMEHAVRFPNATLPSQGIAERYDIVVDFSQFKPGDKLYFVNVLEHTDGKGPNQQIPLDQVLSGKYKGDPAVGKFLEFRVQAYNGTDLSMNPADFEPGKKKMIPLPGFTAEELNNATQRTFEFGRANGTDDKPWTIKTDGGQGYNMDPRRVSAAPDKGGVEIWRLVNGGNGWSHPIHVHFEEGQILKRGGLSPPEWEKWARKDVYRIGDMPDTLGSVEFAVRVREFVGTYMEHCHNTTHEDSAMLLRWDSQNPGQVIAIPTPMPDWDGVDYIETNTTDVSTFKVGDLDAKANRVGLKAVGNENNGNSGNNELEEEDNMNNGKGRSKGSNNDVRISNSGNLHASQNSNSVGEHDDGGKGHNGRGRNRGGHKGGND